MSGRNLLAFEVEWKLLRWVAPLLLIFTLWTAVVWVGIGEGSRSTVWRVQAFGQWPAKFGDVDGSSNSRHSIYASSSAAPAPGVGAPQPPKGSFFGYSQKGSGVDSYDSNNINGSRFVTGQALTSVSAVSVFVPAPVDQAPNNQYQIAIYKDKRGAPGELVAQTDTGTLTPDDWNTLPIRAEVQPNTAYWLMYNTNGSDGSFNNMTFTPHLDSVDGAIRRHRNPQIDRIAHGFEVLGNFTPMTMVVVVLAAWVGRKDLRTVATILGLYAAGLLLVLVLKETLFYPYGEYPSGHSMRTVFAAFLLVYAIPWRLSYLAAALLVALEGLSLVYMGGHYAEEVLGGLLVGAAAALTARSLLPALRAAAADESHPGIPSSSQ